MTAQRTWHPIRTIPLPAPPVTALREHRKWHCVGTEVLAEAVKQMDMTLPAAR